MRGNLTMEQNMKNCLFCVNSLSADAPDGSPQLVCFEKAGAESELNVVDETECCKNYKEH